VTWWHSFTVMTAETINVVVFQHKSQHLPMRITIPEKLRTQPWYTQPLVPNSNGLTLWGPKLAYIMHNDSVHASKAVQHASIRTTDLLVLYMEIVTRFVWSPMVTREPQLWPRVMATISLHMHKPSISEDINCLESVEKFELFKIYNCQTQAFNLQLMQTHTHTHTHFGLPRSNTNSHNTCYCEQNNTTSPQISGHTFGQFLVLYALRTMLNCTQTVPQAAQAISKGQAPRLCTSSHYV